MFLNLRDKSNWFGLASGALQLAFWLYMFQPISPAHALDHLLNLDLVLGLLGASCLAALIAAILGSRQWLLALVGPAFGVIFLVCLRG